MRLSILFSLLLIVCASAFGQNKGGNIKRQQHKAHVVVQSMNKNSRSKSSSYSISTKEVVDLGLSVYWRGYNLGAHSPEEKGALYSLEDAGLKYYYTDEGFDPSIYVGDEGCISGTKYDIARTVMGKGWRTPNFNEMKELKNKCKWKFCIYKGIKGYKVTGPNGNSIFMPCTENDYYGSDNSKINFGRYWQGTISKNCSTAPILRFGIYNNIILDNDIYNEYLSKRHAIRPVLDKYNKK